MKRLNLVLAVFGLAAGAASAQPFGPPPEGRFDIDDLAILLDLDAYQKGELDRVLTEQREALRAERDRAPREQSAASDERRSREDMRSRRDANREELLGKLRNTLTEQQITKLRILTDSAPGGRGPRDGPL
ncbi:MAG: hypothetical protein EHM50_11075 [Lysobacterales bacterium]|nr:MAG: hypothetical protein EHM50_11075 [Xanthomonadales bacterium]